MKNTGQLGRFEMGLEVFECFSKGSFRVHKFNSRERLFREIFRFKLSIKFVFNFSGKAIKWKKNQ